MEDFVTFELAVKFKEKGFRCEYPFAMYSELGVFYALFTSADHNHNIKSVFGDREYYDYDDFDEKDCVCPTISQVLKWLRKEKDIYISVFIDDDSDNPVTYEIYKGTECVCSHQGEYFTLGDWGKCELRAIEYVLNNNLI
ncbi:MAG: hypothetical protein E7083_07555 [Bacteroidales bacterium]|nr:hypothetical protein [Bacteroidales bacterium]